MRYSTAYKHEEPIRQKTPVDYYRTADEYGGHTASSYDYYRTPEKVIPLHYSFIQPGISAQMVYRGSPELKAIHFVVEYPRNNLYIPIWTRWLPTNTNTRRFCGDKIIKITGLAGILIENQYLLAVPKTRTAKSLAIMISYFFTLVLTWSTHQAQRAMFIPIQNYALPTY